MLLKSLWRKTSRSAGEPGESAHGQSAGGFRLREHLTYTGDYHLERLSKLLFYLNCSPTVQEYLKTGGIVDESHDIHNAGTGGGHSGP